MTVSCCVFLCTPVYSYFHILLHSCLHSVSSFIMPERVMIPDSLSCHEVYGEHGMRFPPLEPVTALGDTEEGLGKGKSLGNLLSPPLVKEELPWVPFECSGMFLYILVYIGSQKATWNSKPWSLVAGKFHLSIYLWYALFCLENNQLSAFLHQKFLYKIWNSLQDLVVKPLFSLVSTT